MGLGLVPMVSGHKDGLQVASDREITPSNSSRGGTLIQFDGPSAFYGL